MAQRPLSHLCSLHAWLGASPSVHRDAWLTSLRIHHLLSPALGATVTDVLSGGQFFAVLRLVSHVLSGRDLDPGLVLVLGALSFLQVVVRRLP